MTGNSGKALQTHPVTPDRWEDFATLFGERGACGGCWCMFWRMQRADYDREKGEGTREAMKAIILSGATPGLLAYADNTAVGWCSVAPREKFPYLERSRILKPLDDQPVWSISCLFVDRAFRNQGISVALLRAAIEFAERQGGRIVEGYPVEPAQGRMPAAFVWTGLAAAFRRAGFIECARRSPTRPVMRHYAGKGKW